MRFNSSAFHFSSAEIRVIFHELQVTRGLSVDLGKKNTYSRVAYLAGRFFLH